MNVHMPVAPLGQRPDPRASQPPVSESLPPEADGALLDEAADDASLLRLVGAVATALVVLAAAGTLLA